MLKKELKNIDISQIKEKMNIKDLNDFLKDNNDLMLNYFNNFLKKFCLIKILVDFPNKNLEIINSFNELTLDNILSILNMKELYKLLTKTNNGQIIYTFRQ